MTRLEVTHDRMQRSHQLGRHGASEVVVGVSGSEAGVLHQLDAHQHLVGRFGGDMATGVPTR